MSLLDIDERLVTVLEKATRASSHCSSRTEMPSPPLLMISELPVLNADGALTRARSVNR